MRSLALDRSTVIGVDPDQWTIFHGSHPLLEMDSEKNRGSLWVCAGIRTRLIHQSPCNFWQGRASLTIALWRIQEKTSRNCDFFREIPQALDWEARCCATRLPNRTQSERDCTSHASRGPPWCHLGSHVRTIKRRVEDRIIHAAATPHRASRAIPGGRIKISVSPGPRSRMIPGKLPRGRWKPFVDHRLIGWLHPRAAWCPSQAFSRVPMLRAPGRSRLPIRSRRAWDSPLSHTESASASRSG